MNTKRKRRRPVGPRWSEESLIDDHLASHRQYERIQREEGQEAADAAAARNGWRLPQERETAKPLTRYAIRREIYSLLMQQPGLAQSRITAHFAGVPKFRVVREIQHLAKVGRVRIEITGRRHDHYAQAPASQHVADSVPRKRSGGHR